jgi:tetratricopeptide (TPR) repeat protein
MTNTTEYTYLNSMRSSDAKETIEWFLEDFGQDHLYFAQHAAFPLALTPDLLYRLWINFQRNTRGEKLFLPWIAVADLLLSPLCKEVGHELYEMDITIRAELLTDLKNNEAFGMPRIYELSNFLLDYVRLQLINSDSRSYKLAQSQHWTALSYVRPHQAAHELSVALDALNENRAEQVRLVSLIETLNRLAEPLASCESFAPLYLQVESAKKNQAIEFNSIPKGPNITAQVKKPLKLVYCYAREDKALRDELDLHLSSLKHQRLITSWYDGELDPGSGWEKEIDAQLHVAHIILVLVTPHLMVSEYCYGIEMEQAIARHKAGVARVIPIILRYTSWEGAPFSKLQVLPTGAKPVTQWQDRDKAFWDITVGIHNAIEELRMLFRTKEEWLDEGNRLYNGGFFQDALLAFENAIQIDPTFADGYEGKTSALCALGRYQEALASVETALQLDPNYAASYNDKGNILYEFRAYEDALGYYGHALQLEPDNIDAFLGRASTLSSLDRYQEALTTYEQAIALDPACSVAYDGKAWTLRQLKQYDEALAFSEKALQLEPTNATFMMGKGRALFRLARYEESLAWFDAAIQRAPTLAQIYDYKADTLHHMRHFDEALATYELAYRLDPKLASSYEGKGNVLFNLGHYSEALAAYDQAIRYEPNNASFLQKRGDILALLGRDEEAQQAYKKAWKLG